MRMMRTAAMVQWRIAFVVAALVLYAGCGPAKDETKPSAPRSPNTKPEESSPASKPVAAGKAQVEILLGAESYQKAASALAVGKKLKFKGEVAWLSSAGQTVKMHLAEL